MAPLLLASRHRLLAWIVLSAGALGLTGCRAHDSARSDSHLPSRVERIDGSLAAAVRFLRDRQGPDGAWRSDTYSAFRDGASLTPLVLQTLLSVPADEALTRCRRQGAAYLAGLVLPEGTIDAGPHGLSYPVYTSALTVRGLSQPGNESLRPAREAWLVYLRGRQLTEDLGWQPSDKEYGGWGYASGLPRKPRPGELAPPLTEANLSATVFALEALRSAGCSTDDPAVRKARRFVERCQNYHDDPQQREPRFDDGGFFFIYDDAVRNKAGVAGKDRRDRERYLSYGSTTADGVRALLACGLSPTHERVRAARQWLETHFRAVTHPGNYEAAREASREAVYYYYCWSVAQALQALGVKELPAHEGSVRWAEALADALLERQRDEGSWRNAARSVREDDPLVATSLAAAALAMCRACLTGAPGSF